MDENTSSPIITRPHRPGGPPAQAPTPPDDGLEGLPEGLAGPPDGPAGGLGGPGDGLDGPGGLGDGLDGLAAAIAQLAACDLDRLTDPLLARRTLALQQLSAQLDAQRLRCLAAVDGRGAAGAEHDVQAASTAAWLGAHARLGPATLHCVRHTVCRRPPASFEPPTRERFARHPRLVAQGGCAQVVIHD